MSNIQVTTNQSVIDVTQTDGITVTTPEGQTIAVTVPNSSINVTNTTDDITVLTNGTLNITTTDTDRLVAGSNQVILNTDATMTFPNNVIDFGNQTADLKSSQYSELWYRNANPTPTAGQGIQTYVWSWENQAGIAVESVDNGYKEWFFNANGTTQFPGYTFPYADGSANQVLKTNGSGVLAWYSPSDLNTTYTIASSSTTGGANLTLTGSDSSTDSVAYKGAGATTVTSTDANTITISSTDTNTTYDFAASSTTGGANLNLTGSDSTTDTVKLTNAGHITATYTSATEVTLGSDATDANTASTIVSRDASGNFNAGTVSLDGQLISTRANNTGDGLGQIFLNGSGGNRIDWAATGTGAPTTTTRTAGTKAVLYPAISGSQTDYALGIDSATMWSSVPVNSSSFKFKWYGANVEVASLDGAGTLVVNKGLVGSSANFTDFPNAQFVSAQSNVGDVHNYNIGVAGEAVATSGDAARWGVGVFGQGWTNGATRSAGVKGDGSVSNTADSGSAIGVRGYSTDTHAGGLNIGLYGEASSGLSNYALYTNGGDWAATGAVQIATLGSNGAITLAPNGTGSVALTLANGGNLTNTRNYVLGGIRQTAAEAAGDIWGFGTGTTNPSRGVSLSNLATSTTTTGKRTALVLRNYANTPRTSIIMEAARGTNPSSPTVLTPGSVMMEITGGGYYGGGTDGWTSSNSQGSAGQLRFSAAETWTSTNTGTNFVVNASAIGAYAGTSMNLLSMNSAGAAISGDNPTFFTKPVSAGGTGAIIMDLFENEIDIGGKTLKINSNQTAGDSVIQAYDGAARGDLTWDGTFNSWTFSSAAATTGNRIQFQADATSSVSSVYAVSTDGSTTATVNYNSYRRVAGNNVATKTNDRLGQFTFNGNVNTGTGGPSTNVVGGEFRVYATEDWDNTKSGTGVGIEITKQGTNTNTNVFISTGLSTEIYGDTIKLADSGGTKLTGNKIDYNRVYGQWQYNTTVTPVAADTAYVFPIGTADFNNIATVGSTSRVILGAAGMYNLQFSVQVTNADNQEHTAYIWLVKNGTAVTASMGRITVIKSGSTIAGWNYLIDSANTTDYYEIGYAVSNTAITFPTYASTAFGPSTASLITTVTPVGA